MHFFSIQIFSIAISLASLAVGSFGELVMTRQIISADNISLTCASEDDRAALVWNDDLQQNTANKKFSTIWPRHNPECAIVAPNRCIAYWKRSGDWKLVSSFRYPMGPVFDSRWEDFEEHSFSPDSWSYGSVLNCTGINAIIFSVRGKGTVNMKLCESYHNTLNSCFLITIPNESLAKFEICIDQVWRSKLYKEYPCYERKVSTKHEELLINESEWRTFSVEWGLQNVSISGNAAIITRAFQNSTRAKYLYVGSLSPGKVRFHNYTYVLVEKKDTKLSTFEFNHTEKSFCIELLVSLCTACELHVRIVDSKGNNQTIGIITGNQYRSARSNLPTWKVVKLNTTLSEIYENPVKLEILSIMKQSNPDARWAIDSFRKCRPIGTVRSVSSFESVNSNIKCQKLTSTGSSVVKYDAAVTSNNRTDESTVSTKDLPAKCPCGMVGKFYNVSCTGSCLETLVCTQSECSCAIGYFNTKCDIPTNVRYNISPIGTEDRSSHNNRMPKGPSYGVPNEPSNLTVTLHETGTITLSWISLLTTEVFELDIKIIETSLRNNKSSKQDLGLSDINQSDANYSMEVTILSTATTYLFSIQKINVKESQGQNLAWLFILPILVTCCVIGYVFYRKRKNIHVELKSLRLTEHSNTSATPIGTPGDGPFECHPHPIKLKQFESYVKKSVENGELEIQYTILPKGLMHPCRIGNLPENKSKNRYGNLISYDHSRVILGTESHNSDSGYINANYIQGYCREKAYIATQGPKSNTVGDFWKMIWQEDVRIIAMLVNVMEGKMKMCEQYWPEIGKKVIHGDITILNMEQRVYADYTYRTLELTAFYKRETRQVKHLQYTGWPDQGVPMYSHSIVEYLNELRATPPGPGPIVVHCNAGTGRTGTIILCDICLHHVAAEGTVDLFAEAKKMYSARANMLDNLQQYILAHLMPTQCLLLLPTKLPCSDVTLEHITALKKELKVHMRRLAISSWKDKALRPWEPPKLPKASHLTKNRFPKLMPVDHSLVSLKRYPKRDSSSEYISAVTVDGVKSKGQYLASQLPLPSTLSDFWRLVAEKKVELVVILQRPSPDSFACVDVVPKERVITPVPFITVEDKLRPEVNRYFTTDNLLLTDTSEKRTRTQNVTVLTCKDWIAAENTELPPHEALVALWSATEKVSRPDVPTLVLCHDGVTGCGLYIALSFLLERMAVEQECDVILAVRAVRQSRSEFVYSREQFEYLYDAALVFIEYFSTYSNFA